MLDRPDPDGPAPAIARNERGKAGLQADRGDAATVSGAALLAILRRRKLPLFASIVLAPLLGYVAICQVTPRYTATGTLLYNAPEYNLRELQSILRVDPITDAVMATQAEVLRGLPVVERVADRLNLHGNPEFNRRLRQRTWPERALGAVGRVFGLVAPAPPPPPPIGAAPPGPALDASRNATLHAVQDAFSVSPVKSARVLEVSFTAESPVLAAAAVNIAMDAYIKDQLGLKFRAVHRANDWLESRVKELRAEVRASEDRIAAYRAKEGLVEGVHARLDTEQISQLTEGMARARSDLAAAEARLDAASGRAGANAQAAVAPSVVQLRAQESELTARLQSLLARLGPNHPEVQSLRSQYAESERMVGGEIGRVVAATAADVRADRERVATLERNLQDVQSHVERDSQAQIPLNAMQRDAEASRTLLQSVLERIQQIAQQAAIETPDAHEISLALPPGQPSWPRTGPLMAAASAFGLLFGLLLVYLWELADNTFRSGEDIRAVLDLPCFALIPRVGRRALGQMKIDEYAARKPLSPLAEQFRALRAGLWLKPNRPRIIAITAARPAEGKTTVTLALGRLAAMNGERVVVLDCDLRRPSVDRRMRTDAEPGLVDCLAERATLPEVIRKDVLTGMDTIPAGKAGPDASGLVMSATMARLLQTLRQDYDLVLLDAPPAQAVTDARVVAAIADATLLCVRWRSTPRSVVLHARELLEEAHANVVGAILTQVEVRVHVRSGYADAEVYHPRYGGYFRE
jgi:capsular exopolysaccharide synthesis family protein